MSVKDAFECRSSVMCKEHPFLERLDRFTVNVVGLNRFIQNLEGTCDAAPCLFFERSIHNALPLLLR